ncbi:L,D-transpeptidase family protein [Endozoicomonas arenosclerae]|uniref:L,D-transpeptidase family protein n=1 Tax=Endozoicomonas arenosclerae TaxID=1633495 RepID=UPI0009A172D5|nr:L,D-transpeptidase family protein [Endozoicomonas arenosclerae]
MRRWVVMLIWLSLAAKADNSAYINWIAGLPDQGIPVADRDWQRLVANPSPEVLQKMVRRYALYVDQGRLDKGLYQPGWQIEDQPGAKLDHQQTLSIKDLKRLEPQLPQYQALIQSHKVLREWSLNAVDEFPDDLIFFEDDQHPGVARLNQWLMDLDLVDKMEGDIYTQAHKDVLTEVQLQFNLSPDGRLGRMTRQALLAINHQRIRTLKANLERLRWLPADLPYPHIRVDIAGFNVAWVKDRSKQIVHKAIVGTKHKQTPVFSDQVESVTFNPIWKVPHSIAANSMLRAEKKKPGYLQQEGFIIYESWDDSAPVVAADKINWKLQTPRTFRYRLEQQPSEINRLGRFKLDLPNQYGVYLHDTDKPELFEKNRRSFSSGCTRVQGISALAQTLFSEQSMAWVHTTPDVLTYKRMLNQPVPIYFVYFTAWPDETGRVRFREDIYKQDTAMTGWF